MRPGVRKDRPRLRLRQSLVEASVQWPGKIPPPEGAIPLPKLFEERESHREDVASLRAEERSVAYP